MKSDYVSAKQNLLDVLYQSRYEAGEEYEIALSNGDANASLIFEKLRRLDEQYNNMQIRFSPLEGRLKVKEKNANTKV